MKSGPPPLPRGLTLNEIAKIEGCSFNAVRGILWRAVQKLKGKRFGVRDRTVTAFELLVWSIRASRYELLTAGSLECREEWIETNIGRLSFDDRFRLQNDGRTRSSCRAAGNRCRLSGDTDDRVGQQDAVCGDGLLPGE